MPLIRNSQIPKGEVLLTDQNICELLEISYSTLYNYMKKGPPQKRHKGLPDIRNAKYVIHRGQRRWLKTSVYKIFGFYDD